MLLPSQLRGFRLTRIALVCAVGVTLLTARAAAPTFRRTCSQLSSRLHCQSTHAKRAWLDLDNSFDLGIAPKKVQILAPVASSRMLCPVAVVHASYQPSFSYQNRPPPLI